jgi:predicted permease
MKSVPIWRRYARFFGPDPAADAKDELRFHLESRIDDLVARGWSRKAALREAERQLGDLRALEQIGTRMGEARERRRELRDYWNDVRQDVRYTLRTLKREPGFAIISILILALAIGANVAVFSVVSTLLLGPLPFPESQELVRIGPPPTPCGVSCATFSADEFEEFRAQNRTYQDVTGYEAFTTPDNVRIALGGEPQSATSIMVIANFFQVLGVQPAMGRLFAAEDMQSGPHPEALLTDAYWRRRFNADPAIVGRTVAMNGTNVTIVGVLPASFDFGAVFSPGAKVDLFTPVDLTLERHWGSIAALFGRLKPGVSIVQAREDGLRVGPNTYHDVTRADTKGQDKDAFLPMPLRNYVTGKLRRSLIVLWCAVGTILLIACVNLSNLLLARAAARAKEFAVRGALGASRGRVVRQLLMESLILSAAGAVVGLGLAAVLVQWLAHQTAIALPLLNGLHIDGQALSWAVLISIATAMLFGMVPGLRMAGGNLQEVLKDSSQGAGLGRKHERIRAVLVVAEVALCCMLLVSAGLLLRSFLKVLDVDLGFQPERAAVIQVDWDAQAPTQDAHMVKQGAIFQQMIARIDALPGVEAAGIVDFLPLGPNREWDTPVPEGKTFAPGTLPDPLVYVITPGFVRAMGIGLRGRDFTWDDGPHSQQVVLINASAARIYWPGEDAVGKILTRDGGNEKDRVVGVVADVREESVEGVGGAQIYYPATQKQPDWAQLVIRTSLPPAALGPSVLRALRELNPKQPAAEFRPIRTIVDRANSPRRFFMLLVAAFATLGMLLAALGIYGVVSYSVTQRTREIGVRMALGASAARVERDVLAQTLGLVAAGLAIGTLGSIVSGRLIASLLFGTSPWDAAAYAAMVLALVGVALLSGYFPARRASRIDPITALRNP